jgi:hypothetical protein
MNLHLNPICIPEFYLYTYVGLKSFSQEKLKKNSTVAIFVITDLQMYFIRNL